MCSPPGWGDAFTGTHMLESVRCTQQIYPVILCQFYFNKALSQTSPIASGRATGNACASLTLTEACIPCPCKARAEPQAGRFISKIVISINNDCRCLVCTTNLGCSPYLCPDTQRGRGRGRPGHTAGGSHTFASPWSPEGGLSFSQSWHGTETPLRTAAEWAGHHLSPPGDLAGVWRRCALLLLLMALPLCLCLLCPGPQQVPPVLAFPLSTLCLVGC